MNYRQLQAALQTARNNGSALTVKLNAKKEVLQAEYDRIMADVEPESNDYSEYDILYIDDADLDYQELAEKRRMEAKQKANRYHTDEELTGLVSGAARSRGYSENEAKVYGQKFMECWNTQGYVTAFHRYLTRLAS